MPTATQSVWLTEARRRWFNSTIQGDGCFAVVLCHGVVRLTDLEMWALGMVEHDCRLKPGECRFRHELFDLRQKPVKFNGRPSNVVDRNTSDRERDRC